MPAVPKPVKQEKERSYNSLRRKPGGAEKRSIDYSGFAFPKPAPPKKKRRSYGGLKKQGYCIAYIQRKCKGQRRRGSSERPTR